MVTGITQSRCGVLPASGCPAKASPDPAHGHQCGDCPQGIRQAREFAASVINALIDGLAWEPDGAAAD
jgi:hypothetical protein